MGYPVSALSGSLPLPQSVQLVGPSSVAAHRSPVQECVPQIMIEPVLPQGRPCTRSGRQTRLPAYLRAYDVT